MSIVDTLIQRHGLEPHPEGGWYKQTYKSTELIAAETLPKRFGASRAFSTAIYFLLEKGNFSAFHRIKSDECWHFYAGETLLIYVIHLNGRLETIKLGSDLLKGEQFQAIVPAGCWFAAEPSPGTAYAFVGCTVAPGINFDDFELAKADALSKLFPQHKLLIERLCN